MTTRELKSENPNQVRRTLVGAAHVVSTVVRDQDIQSFDDFIGGLVEIFEVDEERKELFTSEGDFETMVFHSNEDGQIEDWQEIEGGRFRNREDAIKFHNELVEKYEAWTNDLR